MQRKKKEAVTVTFHYLARESRADNGDVKTTPFSTAEFETVYDKLKALPPFDPNDDKMSAAVQLKQIAPVENILRENQRTIFGLYRAAYSGHAYENTAVGKVPADSISLRPFYFLAYLSSTGHIYLGVQYLGQFGGYEALRNTVIKQLENPSNIVAHSFRRDSALFQDVEPSEVKVKIARRPDNIASENVFGEGAVIAFKKKNRDDAFGEEVKKRLIPVMGTSIEKVRKVATEIVNKSGLTALKDEDVADCTVIGQLNGKKKIVYMIEQGLFATQFPINPKLNEDGHPEPDAARKEMIGVLQNQIISLAENA